MTRPMPTDNEVTWSRWIASFGPERFRGVAEFQSPDGSRVDILTDELAIEVEWSKKWAESIGQALLYSITTNRRAAVLLLIRNKPTERLYITRAAAVCERAGIEFHIMETRSE